MAETTATTYAREVNPDIEVLVTATDESVSAQLHKLGASEVVQPAFQASLEFVRNTLGCYQVDTLEIENIACPFLKRLEADVQAETES
jgi:voltage-gated potassium channel Kch